MSKLFGAAFGKKDTPVQTSKTGFETLPGFGQELVQDIVSQGRDVAGTTSPFAPVDFTQQQQQALSQLQSGVQAPQIGNFLFGQQAASEFDRAGDFLGGANQFLDQSSNLLGQASNAFGQFDPTLGEARSSIAAGQQGITGAQLQSGIADFINPFTQQVIDPAVQDIEDAAARRQSILAGQASGNLGAFGGQSAGIENSLINRDVLRETGRIGGQLRSQAFNTASRQALERLTGERNRSLQGGQLSLGALNQITGRASTLGGLGGIAAGLAGQSGALASQAGGLGSRLFDARRGIEDIRGQVRDREVQQLGEIFGAGDIERQFQQQQNQLPLQQLALLQEVLGNIPVGGGSGQLRENQGAVNRVVDPVSKLISAFRG